MNKIILIIPAYNEEETILKTIEKIKSFNQKSKIIYDYLVINDGSTDATEDILTRNGVPHITLIHNLGIGGAVQTGYKYALENYYDIAVQFDGDGQHDVKSIEFLLKPIINNTADMTIGSRFILKEKDNFKSSLMRRCGIKLISLVIKLKTKKTILDTTSGFRAVNRNIIESFSEDYPTEYPEPISTVYALKKGYRIEEIPAKMHSREGGTSSITSWKSIYYMINVILSILIIERSKER